MEAKELFALAARDGDVATLHVRIDGTSEDIALSTLRITQGSDDETIRTALANHFDSAVDKFRSMVIERHATGNITVRPEAVFG